VPRTGDDVPRTGDEVPVEARAAAEGGRGMRDGAALKPLWGPWLDWAQLALLGLAAAVSWAALQRVGLVDRYGADPHDKSQPEALTDLLGGRGGEGGDKGRTVPPGGMGSLGGSGAPGSQDGFMRLLRMISMAFGSRHTQVVLPLLAIPMALVACHRCLARIASEDSLLAGGESLTANVTRRRGRWAWLAAVCMMQYACAALWWAVQAAGFERMDLISAAQHLGDLWRYYCSHVDQGKGATTDAHSRWLESTGGPAMCDLGNLLAALEVPFAKGGGGDKSDPSGPAPTVEALLSGFSVPLLPYDTELRLLLPRLVYGMALTVLAVEVASGLVGIARGALSGLSRASSPSFKEGRDRRTGGVVPAVTEDEAPYEQSVVLLSSEMGHHVWLLGCVMAPVTVLLGHRGPLAVLCGLGMVAALTAVLVTRQSLRLRRLADGAHDDVPLPIAPIGRGVEDLLGVAGPAIWAMSGSMLFFCTGHFCEFSGLQVGQRLERPLSYCCPQNKIDPSTLVSMTACLHPTLCFRVCSILPLSSGLMTWSGMYRAPC